MPNFSSGHCHFYSDKNHRILNRSVKVMLLFSCLGQEKTKNHRGRQRSHDRHSGSHVGMETAQNVS